jgi:sirohydrochlorin cobaltochelatase
VLASLLVTHGSRDPRPQIAAQRLVELILQKQSPQTASEQGVALMSRTEAVIETAALELAKLPLHESIYNVAIQAKSRGITNLQIIPLFLLPGVHVREDIPAEVEQAQQALGPEITLHLQRYLGSYPGIVSILAQQYEALPGQGRILLSHGSRRPQGNKPIEQMAAQLDATPAYWLVEPSLKDRVTQLIQEGSKRIAILPYFLFPGGITEAIAQEVAQLQGEYPDCQLQLGCPLGATPQLANLILKEMAG